MIDSDQADKLRLALSSSGWNDVIKPVIAARAHEAIKMLCLAPSERSGQFKDLDDSSLRGIIREGEWMLNVWENELKVYDHNRRLDELDRQGATTAPPTPTANP